jgi:hypothetical protein
MNFEIFMSKNNILEYSQISCIFLHKLFFFEKKIENYNVFANNVINVKDAKILH